MNIDRFCDLSKCLLIAVCLLTAVSVARADMASFAEEKMGAEVTVGAGYRSFSVHGDPSRAGEYQSLQSGPLFKGKLYVDQEDYHLDLDLNYLGDKEFAAEGHLTNKRFFRLDLRTDRFMHNLEHIPYANGPSGPYVNDGSLAEGARPDTSFGGGPGGTRLYYTDQNPGDDYNLRIDTDEAKIRVKYPDYPAHLNLSYWRYEKEGEKQLRFNNHGNANFGSCNNCHLQSRTRDVNRVTEEVKASVDAHAGFLDIVLEGLLRTFRDRENPPTDIFTRPAGSFVHDEDPDSKLKELTLRLNTAPSGGLVGSASLTIGQRENESDLTSEGPIKAETDYTKTTADVTYAPNEKWTVSMRYRLLDMDNDNTEVLTTAAGAPANIAVPEAMDITRAWYEGLVNYRPYRALTLKAEMRQEDIHRDQAEVWGLPEDETVTRFRLGFNSRLLEKSALKLNGWVAFQHSDDPAYGTSPEDSVETSLSAAYSSAQNWGVTAMASLLKETGRSFDIEQLDTNNFANPADDVLVHYNDLDGHREQQNLSVGAWGILAEGLSVDLNYGYLRTRIDQDLLFGTGSDDLNVTNYTTRNNDVEYNQTVQTLNLGLTWQALQTLTCRAEGYHIRSKASYSPDFSPRLVAGANITAADLHDISKVDIIQNGLKGRVDWKINENLACGLEAAFDDYDEQGNDVFDGSVQSYMANLAYTF